MTGVLQTFPKSNEPLLTNLLNSLWHCLAWCRHYRWRWPPLIGWSALSSEAGWCNLLQTFGCSSLVDLSTGGAGWLLGLLSVSWGEKVFCGLLEENTFLRGSWGEKCRNLIANWAPAIHLNGWRLPAKATLSKEPPLLTGTTWIGGLSRPLRGVLKGHRPIKPSWHRLLSRLTHLLIFQHTWP